MKHSPAILERRINILWMATTGSHHPHGSKAWMARILGVRPRVLRRWCKADGTNPLSSDVGRDAMAKIEFMWKDASKAKLKRARKRLVEYERADDGRSKFERETIGG